MNRNKYLPVWTDGLNYDEQHLTFCIVDNLERVNQNYSLLPIRLEGGYYCGRKRFDDYIHLIDNYFEFLCYGGTCFGKQRQRIYNRKQKKTK